MEEVNTGEFAIEDSRTSSTVKTNKDKIGDKCWKQTTLQLVDETALNLCFDNFHLPDNTD